MKRVAAGAVVAAAVLAGVYLFVDRTAPSPVRGLAPQGDPAFGPDGRIAGGFRALYSPDGRRLAVLSPQGLGLAAKGTVRPITERGAKVVDAAFFGAGETLLVAEGPVPTGGLAVVDISGTVRGQVPLRPSLGFGSGHGMAVAPGGREAVVTAVERPPLAPEQRYLAVVDLTTGATRRLTEPGGADESGPAYLDGARVVFTERAAGGQVSTVAIGLDGAGREVLAAGARSGGVIQRGRRLYVALVKESSLEALPLTGGSREELASLPAATGFSALHPSGGEAVVVESVVEADGATVTRLRRVELRPLPPG